MKALSLSQPWASLLMLGVKRLETRCWHTSHRGPLLIHASKNFSRAARLLCLQEPGRAALAAAGVANCRQLPVGAVLGVVELVDCVRVEDAPAVPAEELPLGDFSPGRWLWRVARPRLLAMPLPYRGRLGLFDIPDSLVPPIPDGQP
jgi:hypothetical protein